MQSSLNYIDEYSLERQDAILTKLYRWVSTPNFVRIIIYIPFIIIIFTYLLLLLFSFLSYFTLILLCAFILFFFIYFILSFLFFFFFFFFFFFVFNFLHIYFLFYFIIILHYCCLNSLSLDFACHCHLFGCCVHYIIVA